MAPYTDLSWYYLLARRFEEAERAIESAMELDPDALYAHWNLGVIYREQSRYDEAVTELQKARTLSADYPAVIAELAFTYAQGGMKDEAFDLLRELKTFSEQQYVSSTSIAIAHIGLRQKDQALERLEAAYEEHDLQLARINVDPVFESLRSEPRFQALLQRMDFPDSPG